MKAVVAAYAAGEITLPKLPAKVNKSVLYDAPGFLNDAARGGLQHPYTRTQVAQLIGWTNARTDGTVQPSDACQIAFHALELVERGLLDPLHCQGLIRNQLAGHWPAARYCHAFTRQPLPPPNAAGEPQRFVPGGFLRPAAAANPSSSRRQISRQAVP